MTWRSRENQPVAVVCGSATPVGAAVIGRFHDAGWRIVTIDSPGVEGHQAADVALQGEIWEERFWEGARERLAASGMTPEVFIHAMSGFDTIAGRTDLAADEAFNLTVRSAACGCQYLTPLMPAGRGAIILLTSVLAGWDTRPEAGIFGTTQAALLALARTQALRGAPAGIRGNAVAMGLVETEQEAAMLPRAVRERIPLGQPAAPDDIADAVLFLLSPDAGHITGSSLVVDGGQSLQSWSNAPRSGGYAGSQRDVAKGRSHQGRWALKTPSYLRRKDPEGPWDAVATATMRFQDRAVLITGAAGGLGSAAARRFASEGARLALLDRDEMAVDRLADELAAGGAAALALATDVTDEGELAAAFTRAEEHFGRLDVIFNNAGVGGLDLAIAETPAARWDELLAVNLRGVFLGCKHGVPALRRAGGGVIVNMGSSTGRHDTITGGAAYMASKAAVEAMTKSLALQVAGDGIRSNTICPGIVETSLSFRQQERGDRERFFAEFAARIPLGRVGQPEDVAAAVAFLASDQARHITGASLLIDGGQTLRRWVSAD